MKIKMLFTVLLLMTFFTGCGTAKEPKVPDKERVSYTPMVCQYRRQASCWTILDCIPLYVDVKGDNTVEVYCGDFYDCPNLDTEVTMDYIYGETFTITDEQKEDLITVLEKNKIDKDEDITDHEACDGGCYYISLYNSDGEVIETVGGYQPIDDRFDNMEESIYSLLPEDTIRNVHKKAEDALKKYLLENYPEEYEYLKDM